MPELNEQMSGILAEAQKMFSNEETGDFRDISYQLLTHAAGLAMFNAVFQQQQMYILKNAVTTATSKAILESNPEDALKLFNEANSGNDIFNTLSLFKNFMEELNSSFANMNKTKPGTKQETKSNTKENNSNQDSKPKE